MNNLQIFKNEEFGEIRTIVKEGEIWFVGKDVATALGYANTNKAITDHVDGEDKGVTKRYTLGGTQNLTIINESGLYQTIFNSTLPTAKMTDYVMIRVFILRRKEIKSMIKLLNKKMAIRLWASSKWIYVKDTNPNEDKNYGADWFYMNNDGEILDKKGEKYSIDSFGTNEEYFVLEPIEERI